MPKKMGASKPRRASREKKLTPPLSGGVRPIGSLEQLQKLKEDDLSRDVLVPLFRAMGYQDVRFCGGGAREQGKDIRMWKPDAARGRINTAVVVKRDSITGAVRSGGIVRDQLKQAFGVPFDDTQSTEPCWVNECLVVTPRDIPKEGTATLKGLIEGERFARSVTFVDGQKLWEWVQQYLGPRTIVPKLRNTYAELQRATGGIVSGLSVELNADGITIRAEGPTEFKPVVREDETGTAAATVFATGVGVGNATSIPFAALEKNVVPRMAQLAEILGLDASSGTVVMSPKPMIRKGSLVLKSRRREVRVPYVELLARQEGNSITVGSASSGSTPFWFSLDLSTSGENPSADFQFRFDVAGFSCHWLALSHSFVGALEEGASIHFLNFETAMEHRLGSIPPGSVAQPPEKLAEIVRKLRSIEDATGEVIIFPSREDVFTHEDLVSIAQASRIIATGEIEIENFRFTLVVPTGNEEPLESLLSGRDRFRISSEGFAQRVLDSMIDLGPAYIGGPSTQLNVISRKSVEEGEEIEFQVARGKKGGVKLHFERWMKK